MSPGPRVDGPATVDPRPWLLDVNVLTALVVRAHLHHRAAHTALSAVSSWAITPATECGLVRLLLNPRVAGTGFTMADIAPILTGLRADPRWLLVQDDASFADTALDLRTMVGHRQVSDFHLVDLAARRGLVLATFDSGLAESLAPADRRHVTVLPVS